MYQFPVLSKGFTVQNFCTYWNYGVCIILLLLFSVSMSLWSLSHLSTHFWAYCFVFCMSTSISSFFSIFISIFKFSTLLILSDTPWTVDMTSTLASFLRKQQRKLSVVWYRFTMWWTFWMHQSEFVCKMITLIFRYYLFGFPGTIIEFCPNGLPWLLAIINFHLRKGKQLGAFCIRLRHCWRIPLLRKVIDGATDGNVQSSIIFIRTIKIREILLEVWKKFV